VNARNLLALAMATAGLMIGHQVAGKAVRDAMFLSAWPATALPTMVIMTSVVAVLAVPIYARLLGAFGPRAVVPAGFLLSALAHAAEWRLVGSSALGAAIVYLHIAAFGALLLSGFWSLVSELVDPRTARASFGRIAAAGTLGGLTGGLLTARLAATWPADSPLLLLAILHAASAAGVLWLGRSPAAFPQPAPAEGDWPGLFRFDALRHAPQLRTLALIVVTSAAGAAIVDFLLKADAARPEHFGTGADLLQFFAVFYMVVQLLTFLLQTWAGAAVQRFGLGRTVAMLPLGLGVTGGLALLYPTFAVFAVVRGLEAILRGSVFRSGYELLFVPMDPAEKRRTKTFLDVTCDRAGDALGALVVWLLLFTHATFQRAELVAAVVALSMAGLWLARRIDTLYLGVVERHLVKQGGLTPIVVGSETGWSIIDLPAQRPVTAASAASVPAPVAPPADGRLQTIRDLRSGDRTRVDAALTSLTEPDAIEIAQVIELLAWDDVAIGARRVLASHAAAHVGLLADALLDPDTDFAIRRRLPHVIGSAGSDRALDSLVRGLEDSRFEVRYRCGRAMDRMLTTGAAGPAPADRVLAVVDRELSVSPAIWRGHHLIDRLEGEDTVAAGSRRAERNLEHVFTLLSAVYPREPLQVAFRGLESDEPGLRALAIEYLDGILPTGIRSKLWVLMEARPDPAADRMSPERALAELRESAEMQRLPPTRPATPSSGDAPAQSGQRPPATGQSDRR
jgi:hypothetical protein